MLVKRRIGVWVDGARSSGGTVCITVTRSPSGGLGVRGVLGVVAPQRLGWRDEEEPGSQVGTVAGDALRDHRSMSVTCFGLPLLCRWIAQGHQRAGRNTYRATNGGVEALR